MSSLLFCFHIIFIIDILSHVATVVRPMRSLVQYRYVYSYQPLVSMRRRSKTIDHLGHHRMDVETRIFSAVQGESVKQTSRIESFDSFDYLAHWYPVVWARDIQLNRPVKVTVFDVDYVLARTSETEVMAMIDKCPHKQAALSEGRITTTGAFQCAYHGWSFNGKTGQCIEIPHIRDFRTNTSVRSARTCGTAVPAMIHQNMIWIFPGGGLEKSLNAPSPPSIPELDQPGYVTSQVIRDFPVDWAILLENIMDPDHGLFAHHSKAFDLYSASRDFPVSLEEEFPNDGKGWKITSRVKAVEKLVAFNEDKKNGKSANGAKNSKAAIKEANRSGKVKGKSIEDAKISTTTFNAPACVVMGRRDSATESTNFISAFYVCPVGTGRSRFMSCSIAKAPFLPPRWIFHVTVNNFLDEDTYLLATQQKEVLKSEAESVQKLLPLLREKTEENSHETRANVFQDMATDVRQRHYAYNSPSEKLGVRLGRFFDKTLCHAPNRISTLLALHQQGAFYTTPLRSFVLNRETQHLQICPDSQRVVRECNRVINISKAVTLSFIFLKAWAILSALSGIKSNVFGINVLQRIGLFLKPSLITTVLIASTAASSLAAKLKREFYFKYDESYHNRKVDGIAKVWLDPSLS